MYDMLCSTDSFLHTSEERQGKSAVAARQNKPQYSQNLVLKTPKKRVPWKHPQRVFRAFLLGIVVIVVGRYLVVGVCDRYRLA